MDVGSSPAAKTDGSTNAIAAFGPFTLDLGANKLSKNGAPVALQLTPLKILAVLVQARGAVVSQEMLRACVWSDRTVDVERSLHTAVKQARQALGDDAQDPRYIQTEPRRGYRFIARVSIGTPAERPTVRRFIPWAAAAAIAALVILFGLRAVTSAPVETNAAPSIREGPAANRTADREQRRHDREARRLRRAAAAGRERSGQ
jgi:DNA-binding winged helix-turn-helix (wHTH) protein